MTNAQRSRTAARIPRCDRRATTSALMIASIASIASIAGITGIAGAACGVEEPADRPPLLGSQPSAAQIDSSDVDCADTKICCAADGARCGGAVDCCPGTTCTAMADGYFRCAVPCSFGDDCLGGCCAPASPDGEWICVAQPCCGTGAAPCNT